jgi:hypothetical protein
VPKFQVYASEHLISQLRARAQIAGIPMSALACVLLDQALSGYGTAAPSSVVLTNGLGEVVADRLEKVTGESAAPDAGEGGRKSRGESAAPTTVAAGEDATRGRAGRSDAPARARPGCPGQPGRGVRCKLCGKTHAA